MESGLDASSAERGVSSTMSSSGVIAHVGVVAFGGSFRLTLLRLHRVVDILLGTTLPIPGLEGSATKSTIEPFTVEAIDGRTGLGAGVAC